MSVCVCMRIFACLHEYMCKKYKVSAGARCAVGAGCCDPECCRQRVMGGNLIYDQHEEKAKNHTCKNAHSHTDPLHTVAPIHISLSCLSNPQKIVSGRTTRATRTLAKQRCAVAIFCVFSAGEQ